MTPAQFGYFTAAPAIGYFLGNAVTGMAAARIGMNRIIVWGASVTVLGIGAAILLTLGGFGGKYTLFGFMTFVGLGNGMTIPSATSGMLSVRPHLAGTASGLGGAIQIGGGAALSAIPGFLLTPGGTELPLLVLMWATGVFSLISILLVILRERQIRA